MVIVWYVIMADYNIFRFCLLTECIVNVVFVIRCLYSAVSLVREQRLIRMIIIIHVNQSVAWGDSWASSKDEELNGNDSHAVTVATVKDVLAQWKPPTSPVVERRREGSYHWRELPQVSFLSQQKFCRDKHCQQQKYAYHDKTFVTTNIFLS